MIVILDVETTGTDRQRDQIIEICLQFGLTEHAEQRIRRLKPTIPVPAEATAIHGITDADLVDCQPFAAIGRSLSKLIAEAEVIAGFNLRFDLEMIAAELERANLPPLDLSRVVLVDAMRLWQHFEPRTLEAGYEKFLGKKLENAHSAGVDVAATGAVLIALLDRLGMNGQAWPAIAEKCDPLPERHDWLGPSHHVVWKDDVATWGVGKHANVRLVDVPRDYLEWVTRDSFPGHVKTIAHAALQLGPDELEAWLVERFGRKAAA